MLNVDPTISSLIFGTKRIRYAQPTSVSRNALYPYERQPNRFAPPRRRPTRTTAHQSVHGQLHIRDSRRGPEPAAVRSNRRNMQENTRCEEARHDDEELGFTFTKQP